jgi:3-hydroxymyristoyl/3-hydroxydecanoyl-(acyl carrier protein) dehydratase
MSFMSPLATHETTLRIDANHPSLPGHFPGQPLVPGVLLLDRVLCEAERWLGRPLSAAALPQAKFTAPLSPDATAHLSLKLEDNNLRFSLTCEGAAIAQGTFRLAQGRSA